MISSVIGWMVFGLIAGAVARMLHQGPEGMGMAGTIVLGVLGSLMGGGIAYLFRLGTSPYEPAGWILSIVGAIVLFIVVAFISAYLMLLTGLIG